MPDRSKIPAIEGGLPVRDTYLPYGQHWVEPGDIEAVVEILRGDWITQGPTIARFEKELAQRVGARYAVTFSSGTAALHGACFAADICQGDEVITTPLTFAASSNCILYQGGKPVFADIQNESLNIDPAEVERKISSRTKAIIPVDFAGQPAELDEIRRIAERHNLVVIEDGAHSLGAIYRDRKVGSISDMTIFSFHPVKAITTGEGGAVTTDNKAYYQRLLLFRTHGITKDPKQFSNEEEGPWYYEMQELGHNYRITDFQCAIGLQQLQKLGSFIKRRRQIAQSYSEVFQNLEEVRVPVEQPDVKSAWHIYTLRLNLEQLKTTRRQIFEALRKENIGVNVHYIPVYYFPYYQSLGYQRGLCPRAESYYKEAITLPLFPKMSDQDTKDVIKAVRKVVLYYSRR